MSAGFWRLLMAAGILVMAGISADKPQGVAVPLQGVATKAPDPQPEGYAYGMRGNHPLSASVISNLEIAGTGNGEATVRITVRKGPQYAATDPDKNGYEGCTLLDALTGGFFEDTDSAQALICWKDSKGNSYVGNNLVEGPTLWRSQAALWQWADEKSKEEAQTSFVIGKDAVELTVLVLYTDVLYAYSDVVGPEDGPAIMASWDAQRVNGRWTIMQRNDMGLGCYPDMEENPKTDVLRDIREQIESRTGGRYSLQRRFNLGFLHPATRNRVIQYDSGYDIVPTPVGP